LEETVMSELEQQIIAALSDDTMSAATLAELVADTEVAITEADAAAETAKTAFLDPVASPDANKARALMETTEYAADRLRTLRPRLEARHQKVDAAEYLTKWRTKYEVLKSERDALAEELGAIYPAAVTAISDVLVRIADHDRRLSTLHQSRPAGGKGRLLSPELIARGIDEFSRDEPSVTRELRLPDWRNSERMVWPPRQPSPGVMIAESMLPNRDPRYTADWAAAKDAEIAARRAEEQQCIADEAARSAESKREYEASLPR
jgi:hypothetical protein